MTANDTESVPRTEQVLYECGESRWDDGPGEAPNECPTCGAPIDAVRFGGGSGA